MESPFQARGRFERASFLRHIAICAAAAAACLLREHVHAGNDTLWILGITVVVNLLITVFADQPRLTRFSLVLSPIVGLAGWTVLVHLTGGVSSVFVAGFWLEIVLSAWICSTHGTLLVTAGAVAALWGQQSLLGTSVSPGPLLFQTAFLTAMGGLTVLLNRHWARAQREAAQRHDEVRERLAALEEEVEVLRSGETREDLAGLAHAIKNAIHSLRGFAVLIDTRQAASGRAEAFDGLRAVIDRLEEIARTALGCRHPGAPGVTALVDGAETRNVIEEAIEEVSASYPDIGWRKRIDERLPTVHADRATLREALLNLARNAAEAMNGAGEIAVETVIGADRFEIQIKDHGSGLREEDLKRMHEPGFTTKPGGSGFGLFLTQRSLAWYGGQLTVAPARNGGTVVCVGLPRGRRVRS